jgi:hypothetical protein
MGPGIQQANAAIRTQPRKTKNRPCWQTVTQAMREVEIAASAMK